MTRPRRSHSKGSGKHVISILASACAIIARARSRFIQIHEIKIISVMAIITEATSVSYAL